MSLRANGCTCRGEKLSVQWSRQQATSSAIVFTEVTGAFFCVPQCRGARQYPRRLHRGRVVRETRAHRRSRGTNSKHRERRDMDCTSNLHIAWRKVVRFWHAGCIERHEGVPVVDYSTGVVCGPVCPARTGRSETNTGRATRRVSSHAWRSWTT